MGTFVPQDPYLAKFSWKSDQWYTIKRPIIPLDVDRGLRSMDVFQKLINCSLHNPLPVQKISSNSIHNFLSYAVNKQTNRQTNKRGRTHNLLYGGNKYDDDDDDNNNNNLTIIYRMYACMCLFVNERLC